MSSEGTSNTVDQTHVVDVGDISVTVQPPEALQLAMTMRFLKRGANMGDAPEDPEKLAEYNRKVINLMTKALDLLEAMIISEDDRDAVAEAVIMGKVKTEDLAKILMAFQGDDKAPTNGPVAKKAVKARRA